MTIIEPMHVRFCESPTGLDSHADGLPMVVETVATSIDRQRAARGDALAPMRRGLPLPALRSVRSTSSYYAVTTVDAHGRFADTSPLRVLHWVAGLRVDVTPASGTISVRPNSSGRDMITRQGHVRLPARVRYACGLRTGDRLLVVGCPSADLLIAYTIPTLDALFQQHALANDGVR